MPQLPAPHPASLRGRAFTVHEGAHLGLTPEMLRNPRFASPFRGVRVAAEELDGGPHPDLVRARALSLLLRENEAISHVSALQLFGCPVRHESNTQGFRDSQRFRDPQSRPMIRSRPNPWLHVTVQAPDRARRMRGVIGHATQREFATWSRADGVKVVPPMLALAQSAAALPLRELVVAIDSLVLPRRDRRPMLDLEALDSYLGDQSGRGIRTLRRAATLARVGAESRMETLLRLVLEAFGLAEYFELQVDLSDEGGWIGRLDLVCKRCRLVLEYDGQQHRTNQAQYVKDMRRLDRVRDAGYRVIRVHAGELLSTPKEVARRVAVALGLKLEHNPRCPELLG